VDRLHEPLQCSGQEPHLSPDEVLRIAKARLGLGVACNAAAAALEQLGEEFTAPKGVTPKALRELGHRAEAIDIVISDVEQMLSLLKQANLLFDAEALAALIAVNDQAKAQGKKDERIRAAFAGVSEYFANPGRPAKAKADKPS
jgi:hypothetical protein